MIEYKLETLTPPADAAPAVSIIGIGGAGSNVLDHIALEGMSGVELISMNCDARSLTSSMAQRKVQIGKTLTQGLGCGGDPELGQEAAVSSLTDIRDAMTGRRMIFVCVGLGGGTSSGAAPVVARLARETGAFVVVFATMPFVFEGRRRLAQAQTSLEQVRAHAHALVCFENDKMGELILPKKGVAEAFEIANKIICQSVRAVTTVATQPGLIRIGLDDLVTALKNADSRCLFGFGQAKGEARATEALANALKSPLLDRGQLLEQARNVLVHICGGHSLTLFEIETLMRDLHKHVSQDAQILFGAACDEKQGDSVSVTIISSLGRAKAASPFTALESQAEPAPPPPAPPVQVTPLISPRTMPVPILSVQPRQLPGRPGALLEPGQITATTATAPIPVMQLTAQTFAVKPLKGVKFAPLARQEPDLFAAPAPEPVTEGLPVATAEPVIAEFTAPVAEEIIAAVAEPEVPAAAPPAVEEVMAESPVPEVAEEVEEIVAEEEVVFAEEIAAEEEIEEEIVAEEEVIAVQPPEPEEEPAFIAEEKEKPVVAKTEDEDEDITPHPAFAAGHEPRHAAPMRHIDIPQPAPRPAGRKFDLREILQKQRQSRMGRRHSAATQQQPAPAPQQSRPALQPPPRPDRPEVPAHPQRIAGTPDPARVTPIRPITPAQPATPRHASPFLPTRAPGGLAMAEEAVEEAEQTTFDHQLEPQVRAGRFERTEPTMDGAEDLDIPTYLRRKR